MNTISKKILTLAVLLLTALAVSAGNTSAKAKKIHAGNILHCFNWTYAQIVEELDNIKAAGFTSVQTSPAQANYDGVTSWNTLYRPRDSKAGPNTLGDAAGLKALCDAAHARGMYVIVDVVANHTDGSLGWVADFWKNTDLYHTETYGADDGDRYRTTHGKIGMMDLKTEDTRVQAKFKDYVQELISLGVDGCRWDAAKHIGLPSEGDNFWKAVITENTGAADLYHYGEVLYTMGGGQDATTLPELLNYMAVTDANYGTNSVLAAFKSGNVPSGTSGWADWLKSNQFVFWGESHDTYCNGDGASVSVSQETVDRAYAVAAAFGAHPALYYSRPSGYGPSSQAGIKGSTHYTVPQVAEVNKYKIATAGEADYYAASNGVASVSRAHGAVIVKGNGSGQVSAINGGGYLIPGSYKDHVSGNTFTVTSTTISGNVGNSGIAVLYVDAEPIPATGLAIADVTVKENKTARINVTYTPADANTGIAVTWSSDNTAVATVADGVVTGIAQGTATITATLANGATAQCVVTVTEGPAVPHFTGYRVYFENTASWATVNCYAWNATVKDAWPGNAMTKDGDYWYISFDFEPTNVIFNNGSDQTDDLEFANGYLYKADGSSEQYAICDGQGDDPTPPTPPTPDDEIKLYFENTGNWSKVYCYVWTPEALGEWPGTEVTEKEDKYFVVTVTDASVTNVIFNNGDGSQTPDLTIRANAIYNASGDTGKTYTGGDDPTPPTPDAPEFDTDYRVYYNNANNWGTPYCYAWNAKGNNTWPGKPMTKDNTTGYWYADFDFEPTNVIFSNNGSDQTDDLDFGNGYLYQADGTGAPYAKHKDTPVPPVVKVGDVDLDGDVDADDYDAIVDIILQKTDMPAAATDAFTAADANADGTIDAEDIMAVELMIATPDIAPTGIAPTKDLRISVASATPVAQLQFVMTLPNGMAPVELTTTTADNHEVTLVAKGGKYLATVLSDDNSNITEDIVLKMQVGISDSPVSFSAVQAATGGAAVQAVAATLSAQFDEEPVVETAISCETSVSMKANSTHAIDLNITSDDHIGVVAANISLPEGITFADNALASSVDNMPFLGNTLTDGSMQVVLSSPSAALIHPSADAKFGAFTVKSGSKVAAGAQIVISDITVVDVAAAGTPLADIVIAVTVEDDLATGISTILTSGEEADVYDIAGRHLGKKSAAQLPKGIYVINGHKVVK